MTDLDTMQETALFIVGLAAFACIVIAGVVVLAGFFDVLVP